MLTLRTFSTDDTQAVVSLWMRCELTHPNNDPHKDIARKLRVRGDLFLVGMHDGELVATVMIGYEGHRGWINYLAVAPEYQKHGYGRLLMDAAEQKLRAEGCAKINLQVHGSNSAVLAFYRTLGYAQDDVVSLGKRLEFDSPPPVELPLVPENFNPLANALVRLESRITPPVRTELNALAHGRTLGELARALRDATDPSALASAASMLAANESGCTCSGDEPPEPTHTQQGEASERLMQSATSPFTKLPALRDKLATLGLTVRLDGV